MKKPLIIIALIALAALNGPWVMEGASRNCAAAERAFIRADKQPTTMIIGAFSDGRIGELAASEVLPHVPSSIACAYTYWLFLLAGTPHKTAR